MIEALNETSEASQTRRPNARERYLEKLAMQAKNPKEKQVGGDHYAKMAIQPVDFIEENNLTFLQGNVIKYIVRHQDKHGKQDLLKAIHYIELMIERHYPEGDEDE
jgi:hypothetical protein